MEIIVVKPKPKPKTPDPDSDEPNIFNLFGEDLWSYPTMWNLYNDHPTQCVECSDKLLI